LSILILSLAVYFSIIKGSIVLYLDSILGISISFYFAIAGLKLANRAINELMDRAPIEAIKYFEKSCGELGIKCKNTRARRVGNKVFLDSTIILPEKLSIEEAHDFANKIEEKIKYYLKDEKLDITIHMETEESEKRSEIMKRVGDIAKETKGVIGVHDISVIKEKDQYHVRLHVEVSPTVTLKEAGLIGKNIDLGTLGISLALVAIFVYILYEAFHRFFQIKYEIEFSELVAFFLVLTIMIDYWRSKVLLKYSKKFS
jgi:divalent metal cation (Fe/Co/Zn/Cd) transporter